MADCPNCSSILRFDIKSQMLHCDSCGSDIDPYVLENASEAQEQEDMGVTVFSCPNCGGEIFSTDRDLTGCCSYCGSNVTFASRMSNEKRPKFIIPFRMTKEECKEAYVKKIKGAFFAPKELCDPQYIDGFRGIYMPYWNYEVENSGDLKLYAQNSVKHDDYNVSSLYRVTGKLKADYSNLIHDASSSFADDLSERIEPFNLGYVKDPESKRDKNEAGPSGNTATDMSDTDAASAAMAADNSANESSASAAMAGENTANESSASGNESKENGNIKASHKKGRTGDGKNMLRPFSPAFLSGFYAESMDVDSHTYDAYVKETACNKTDEYIRQHNKLKNHIILNVGDHSELDNLEEFSKVCDWTEKEQIEYDQNIGGSKKKKNKNNKSEEKNAGSEKTSHKSAIQKGRPDMDKPLSDKELIKLRKEKMKELEKRERMINTMIDNSETAARAQMKALDNSDTENSREDEDTFYQKTDRQIKYDSKVKNATLIMLPVWFLSYKNGKRVAYATVNGQTGRVSADIPIDLKKCGLFTAVIAVILYLILRFFTFRTQVIATVAVWFAATVTLMISAEMGTVFNRMGKDNGERLRVDKSKSSAYYAVGMMIGIVVALFAMKQIDSVLESTVLMGNKAMAIYSVIALLIELYSLKSSQKLAKKIKEQKLPRQPGRLPLFLSSVLGCILVIKSPASDFWYYSLVCVQILLISFVLIRMLLSFNKNATRPLPQFASHQGGDDNA